MIRAPMGDTKYWEGRVAKFASTVQSDLHTRSTPSANPSYEPQFWFDHSKYVGRLILLRYSRGDPIADLGQHFPGILDAWELSNKLADDLNSQLKPEQGWDHRRLAGAPLVSDDPRSHSDPRAWTFDLGNLNHYNWCFWLVAMALLLEVPDEQWQRLLALVDGEGRDELLDRVVATRTPARPIGTTLLHPKPYARLLAAIKAPEGERSALLKEFVTHWYAELARKGSDELWWYIYGDPVKHPLSMGSYFGRWCLEAAAAAKMFAIDDSACLGHEHYPGDFLHPEDSGAKLEVARKDAASGWLKRLLKRR